MLRWKSFWKIVVRPRTRSVEGKLKEVISVERHDSEWQIANGLVRTKKCVTPLPFDICRMENGKCIQEENGVGDEYVFARGGKIHFNDGRFLKVRGLILDSVQNTESQPVILNIGGHSILTSLAVLKLFRSNLSDEKVELFKSLHPELKSVSLDEVRESIINPENSFTEMGKFLKNRERISSLIASDINVNDIVQISVETSHVLTEARENPNPIIGTSFPEFPEERLTGRNIHLEVEYESFSTMSSVKENVISLFVLEQNNNGEQHHHTISLTEHQKKADNRINRKIKWEISGTDFETTNFGIEDFEEYSVVVNQDMDRYSHHNENQKSPYFEILIDGVPQSRSRNNFYYLPFMLRTASNALLKKLSEESAIDKIGSHKFSPGERLFYIGGSPYLERQSNYSFAIHRLVFDPNASCIDCP